MLCAAASPSHTEEALQEGLSTEVVEIYRNVGKLMSRFTVGKVPKAFKIIPNLRNWEDVLYMTDPDNFSPHASKRLSTSVGNDSTYIFEYKNE